MHLERIGFLQVLRIQFSRCVQPLDYRTTSARQFELMTAIPRHDEVGNGAGNESVRTHTVDA